MYPRKPSAPSPFGNSSLNAASATSTSSLHVKDRQKLKDLLVLRVQQKRQRAGLGPFDTETLRKISQKIGKTLREKERERDNIIISRHACADEAMNEGTVSEADLTRIERESSYVCVWNACRHVSYVITSSSSSLHRTQTKAFFFQ